MLSEKEENHKLKITLPHIKIPVPQLNPGLCTVQPQPGWGNFSHRDPNAVLGTDSEIKA